jgi:hypothetical protein
MTFTTFMSLYICDRSTFPPLLLLSLAACAFLGGLQSLSCVTFLLHINHDALSFNLPNTVVRVWIPDAHITARLHSVGYLPAVFAVIKPVIEFHTYQFRRPSMLPGC